MRHCAIIPARSGSKGLPGKNLIELPGVGRNLIELTIDKAKNSRIFSGVYITTDYEKQHIDFTHDLSFNAKTHLVHRPKSLTTDDATMIEVVKHVMKPLTGQFDWLWVLQPTSPFRRPQDFDQIKELVEGFPEDINSLISFKPVKEHTNRVYTCKEDIAYRLKHTSYANRQELPGEYIRSGAFYVVREMAMWKDDSLESRKVYCYLPDKDPKLCRALGINIDDEEDLILAKYYMQKGYVKARCR